jgi:rRNA maturation endonuclease Nob1
MAESIVNPIGRNVDKVVQNVYNSLPIGNQRRLYYSCHSCMATWLVDLDRCPVCRKRKVAK